MNLDATIDYVSTNRSGSLKAGMRGTIMGDYNYGKEYIQWINHQRFIGLELHSRFFYQLIVGNNIAPESQLYLSGANPEEMMDNKYTRSRGFIPDQWLGYGNNYNHFQAGGGLNIRGYAGYLVPRTADNVQVYMNKGNNGGAINLELDLDGLVTIKPKRIADYFHLDVYLFGDGGFLQHTFKSGEFGLTKEATVNTGFMASAGAGMAFTIKKWGSMDKAKPLTLRFDIPLFLSNSPYVDGNYFKYRWQMGINRSF
jgi:aminopeptidase N